MESINWYSILQLALEGLVPLVVVVLTGLITYWLKKRDATEKQRGYIMDAWDLLCKAVISTNQTWVDALKRSGGGLTEEQQAEARVKTRTTFYQLLTDEVSLALVAAYGSVEDWFDNMLESAVGDVKAR